MDHPATDERQYTDEALGFELFWERNKAFIIAGVVALILAGLASVGWLIHSHNLRLAAEQALATATTAEEWRTITEQYRGQPAAQTARLLLAESLRDSGDRPGSSREYQTLISEAPGGLLAGVAALGIAMNSLGAGDTKRGLEELAVASGMGDAFTAQMAMLLKGRELMDAGDFAGARTTFQALAATFNGSIAAGMAGSQLQQLALVEPARPAGPVIGGEPASSGPPVPTIGGTPTP